jgi:hypothetical protein
VSGGKAKLIDGGRNLQQPLHVYDLARAAVARGGNLCASADAQREGDVQAVAQYVAEAAFHVLNRQELYRDPAQRADRTGEM